MTPLLSSLSPAFDKLGDVAHLGLDALLVFILFYVILSSIEGVRQKQIMGVILALFGASVASSEQWVDLPTLHWLLEKLAASLLLILVILFQSDLRYALMRLMRGFSGSSMSTDNSFVEDLIKACGDMQKVKIGALIAIQRRSDLNRWAEGGIKLEARISKELLYSIFIPECANPLHDGAVIIQHGRITAAACFLPLTSSPSVDSKLGTRHRAAIGLSEDTDAILVVVSEETGIISVAYGGSIERNLDQNTLRDHLHKLMSKNIRAKDDDPRGTAKGAPNA